MHLRNSQDYCCCCFPAETTGLASHLALFTLSKLSRSRSLSAMLIVPDLADAGNRGTANGEESAARLAVEVLPSSVRAAGDRKASRAGVVEEEGILSPPVPEGRVSLEERCCSLLGVSQPATEREEEDDLLDPTAFRRPNALLASRSVIEDELAPPPR